jgi:hypothetical protein
MKVDGNMHWCMDETLAVLAMIPFIGYFFRKLHTWYHSKMDHLCHEKHCDDVHVEHNFSPYHTDASCRGKMQRVSKEDMEYLRGEPAPLKVIVPVAIEEAPTYGLNLRGLIVGTILAYGPMTHEQLAIVLSDEDEDAVYSTIKELMEHGTLILDGPLLKEGKLLNDS